ncbi:MAG: hypothetical protein M3Z22_07475 [Verrucomicrobiota bacterium]|nr:hypothetical protein [Verrucomicrobiota bacterium]
MNSVFSRDSAFNFLQAIAPGAKVYSYDVADHAEETARTCFRHYRNYRFLHKSQSEFAPDDIDYAKVDLVFFEAVHDLALNQETWKRAVGSLSERCLVVVHDTGTWTRSDALANYGPADLNPQWWLNDEYQHQRGEREFVNWITREYSDYSQIHFHSLLTLRHGLTILQRNEPLPT